MALAEDANYVVSFTTSKKRVLVRLPNNERACMSHKALEVTFRHKRTGDSMLFRLTGKGKYYQDNGDVGEQEARSEFQRLLGSQLGTRAFSRAEMILALL